MVITISHVGIAGNELADSAARRAASVPCTRRLPLPARDFYPAIGSYVLSQWQRSWDTLAGNKLRELKPTLRAWPSSICRRRRDEVTLCRLRIGHTYATHGYLLHGEERPICPLCQVPLTVAHILLVCRRYSGSRARHLGYVGPSTTVSRLLGDDSVWVHSGSLFSFIQDIKLAVIYSPR